MQLTEQNKLSGWESLVSSIHNLSARLRAGADTANSTNRVYGQIKLMAMTYQFRPGERINEVHLATRLNVSRTPVREALNRLSSEGFLSTLPNRGFFGRLLDVKEIYNLYESRCLLEQAT